MAAIQGPPLGHNEHVSFVTRIDECDRKDVTVNEPDQLAEEFLTETRAQPDADAVELRVRLQPRAVRLEIAWTDSSAETPLSRPAASGARVKTIRRLADRWGLTHRGGRHCFWAEKSTAIRWVI